MARMGKLVMLTRVALRTFMGVGHGPEMVVHLPGFLVQQCALLDRNGIPNPPTDSRTEKTVSTMYRNELVR